MNIWPWDSLVELGDGVLMGGTKILTREGKGYQEHFWFKGKTLYKSVPLLRSKEFVDISRRVFNVLRNRADKLVLLDYHSRAKCTYSIQELYNLKEADRIRTIEDILRIPILNVEEYVPDKNYQKFAKKADYSQYRNKRR